MAPSRLRAVALSALVLLLAAGCARRTEETFCFGPGDCRAGETCDTSTATCGCVPGLARDACSAADEATVCHPDERRCVETCSRHRDCRAGTSCDAQARVCRDPDAFADCTRSGSTCPAQTYCDAASRRCLPVCTEGSCGAGELCHLLTQRCEPRCLEGACGAGKTCDPASGYCLPQCGQATCRVDQACRDGACLARCDVPGGATCAEGRLCDPWSGLCEVRCNLPGFVCGSTHVCDPATQLCIPRCRTSADCAGGAGFCEAGLCVERADISTCAPLAERRESVDPATNRCAPTAGRLDACALASARDAERTEAPLGPTAFAVERLATLPDGGRFCSGASAVELAVHYWAPEGEMLRGGQASPASIRLAIAGEDAFAAALSPADHSVAALPGSTAQRGRLRFTLCRAPSAPAGDTLALYLVDWAERPGNTLCVTLTAAATTP